MVRGWFRSFFYFCFFAYASEPVRTRRVMGRLDDTRGPESRGCVGGELGQGFLVRVVSDVADCECERAGG